MLEKTQNTKIPVYTGHTYGTYLKFAKEYFNSSMKDEKTSISRTRYCWKAWGVRKTTAIFAKHWKLL